MKSEKGITLTSLVIYIIVLSIFIATLALINTFFFENIIEIKEQEKYAPEFNKFAMFFIKDVKNNERAIVTESTVTFEDGNIYEYNSQEKQIYRNKTVIAKQVQDLSFNYEQTIIDNTTKNIIVVDISLGEKKVLNEGEAETGKFFTTQMRFVLKYW